MASKRERGRGHHHSGPQNNNTTPVWLPNIDTTSSTYGNPLELSVEEKMSIGADQVFMPDFEAREYGF